MLHCSRTPESVETLYIGVDHEKYDADKVEAGQVRQALGIADDRKIVLFPCRMHPQKRPFLMLEIAEQTKQQIPNIAFVAVGDGPQLEELRQVANNSKLQDTVYFAGRADDMLPYYKDSDVTLICSLKEGLALTAYESLSMGVPVISSDVGGQKELIDAAVGKIIPLYQDEETDLDNREFATEEVQAYAVAIVDILSDKKGYVQMSKNCRNKIENGFSTTTMIEKLEAIFTAAITDEHILQNRKEKHLQIASLGNWAEDYFALYADYENKESVLNELWESKQWLHEQYHYLKGRNDASQYDLQEISKYVDAEKELAQIHNMRTWKLIQKYRIFMDTTWLGKKISKIRDFIIP